VTSLLAGVGVVGLALGFAFQDIAANFMSGFMMAMRRPFTVGDLVEVGGKRGKVEAIALRATELQTLDGLSVMIPNKDVFQSPIINFTRTNTRRVDIPVGVAYSDDLDSVREKARSAVEDLSHRVPDRDIDVLFDEFGSSSINLTVRVWLDQSDEMTYRAARSEAIIAIKKTFDDNNISSPFPIRTLDFGAGSVGGARIDAMKLQVANDDATTSNRDDVAQSG
jgi:small conductance mechanosensitive channel